LERKVRTVAEIEKKAGPDLTDDIIASSKTLREVRTAIRRAERIEKTAGLSAPRPLRDRKYPVLLIERMYPGLPKLELFAPSS
jgi:hypothetical protein